MQQVIPHSAIRIPDSARCVFSGEIFDVYQWPQKLYDDSTVTFEMLKRPDTVVAMCIVDDTVLVLDDEQPGRGTRKSFPGGRVDKTDDSILSAAQREIHEETGYSFNNWKLLRVYQPQAKIEWFVNYYVAWDVAAQDAPHLDPGERISVHKLSFDELKHLVFQMNGYLGEVFQLLTEVHSNDELIKLPEFNGQTIDR